VTDPEAAAELEDRAAELVDRDHLLALERADWRQAWAELQERDRADLTAEADRWEAIKARSGHSCDYGGYWSGVL
jgi:hypothetical protein